MKGKEGSITVFFTLLLVPMLSMLLTLLEGARVQELAGKAQISARMSADSVMAEYSNPLWKEYDVLFLDGSYGTGEFNCEKITNKIEEYEAYNNGQKDGIPGEKGGNYLRLPVKEVQLKKYEFATDEGGNVFRHEAVRVTKDAIPAELLEMIRKKAEEVSGRETTDKKPEKFLKEGEEAKEKAEQEAKKIEETEKIEETKPEMTKEEAEEKYDNEMKKAEEDRKKMEAGGMLAYYTDGKSISSTTFDLSNRLEVRTKNKGNRATGYSSQALEKLIFQQYIKKKFSCYTNEVNQHEAKYEMEYIIAGKGSDKENLENVITRLFAVRELFNLAYRFTDKVSIEEAEAIGTALAFWIPGLGPQVAAAAILAARSVSDSIQDVKALMKGERVALIKGNNLVNGGKYRQNSIQNEKKVDLKKPGNGVNLEKPDLDESKDNESEKWEAGLTYEDYLQIFMYLQKDEQLNFRTMDLIEWSAKKQSGYENFRMDCMVYKIDGKVEYESGLIFDLFHLPGAPESWKTQGDFHGSYEKQEK